MDDNRRMTRRARKLPISVVPLGLVLGLALGACGYAEWPPPGARPNDINRAPPRTLATASQSASAFRNASAVIVGDGDTVYALSRRHGVSTRAIIDANGLTPPFHLIVGQRIELPRYPEHEVASGDTLSAVAARYDVGMYEMARLNDLEPPYTIFVGQRLRLPGTGTPAVRVMAKSTPRTEKNIATKTAPKSRQKPTAKPAAPPPWSRTTVTSKAPGPTAVTTRPAPRRAVPKPPPASGKGFLWPVKGRVVSGFGAKAKGFHNDGINIAAPRGTAIHAAENGVVVYAGNELRGFGNLLLIKHANGWVTAYAHAERLLVARGDKVGKGQRVATVGATGSVTQPQLHFEIRKGKRARDPRKHLRRA